MIPALLTTLEPMLAGALLIVARPTPHAPHTYSLGSRPVDPHTVAALVGLGYLEGTAKDPEWDTVLFSITAEGRAAFAAAKPEREVVRAPSCELVA